jgi:acetylornithine deacetylase/succinyl-diaminopimelate desuccinylase-like protein
MITYLEKLVGIYPVSSDQKAVKQLLEYVGEHLQSRGFSVSILTYDGVHNLYASLHDKRHSRLLLQGHVDVVPGRQPFKVDGDKCLGRGTYDMLYGTAAFMQLADDLFNTKQTPDIAIMLSGDEEKGGFLGVNKMLADGYDADICLLPDAGEGFGSLNVAAKGVFDPTIRISGRAHHGSRPWEGDGAGGKLVRFLTEVENLFDTSSREHSTMTIARVNAGTAMNQGPASAETSLDIRYKDKVDLIRIKAGLSELLEKYDGEITSIVDGSDYQLDTSHPLVSQFVTLYERHAESTIRLTKAHGSSDARFFSERNIPVIMLRPNGGGAHGDNEWVSLESCNKFYALLREYVTLVATKV